MDDERGQNPSEWTSPVFATTRWSVVLTADGSSLPATHAASERLCGDHWFPLYGYVRAKGFSQHEAGDELQQLLAAFG